MKSRNRLYLIPLALTLCTSLAHADRAGNGAGPFTLDGFENFRDESKQLSDAITAAEKLVEGLHLDPQQLPELTHLQEEIEFSKYIREPNDVEVVPNRAPGDYPIGSFLVASTDTVRGAPTRIYPKFATSLSDTQLEQMVVHEALHRALPEPMNSYEAVVVRITSIITQYATAQVPSALRSYLDSAKKIRMPWIVHVEIPFHGIGCGIVDEAEEQSSFNELVNEGIISVSTADTPTRVRITISYNGHQTCGWGKRYPGEAVDDWICNCEFGPNNTTLDDFSVVISDNYRNSLYRLTKDPTLTSNIAQAKSTVLAFIKSTLDRIQNEDLMQ